MRGETARGLAGHRLLSARGPSALRPESVAVSPRSTGTQTGRSLFLHNKETQTVRASQSDRKNLGENAGSSNRTGRVAGCTRPRNGRPLRRQRENPGQVEEPPARADPALKNGRAWNRSGKSRASDGGRIWFKRCRSETPTSRWNCPVGNLPSWNGLLRGGTLHWRLDGAPAGEDCRGESGADQRGEKASEAVPKWRVPGVW
ncbi:uncharacterized protein LOC120529584 [Polypterus senegalus]|uniref:uncharacterized protein LOC120529584 n=1 Tax=Polypterus senegalus TaxID=55291 RepID=UPI0019668990|nr:uncharacterized protein LOC120529584 [Polypterus senegalus]